MHLLANTWSLRTAGVRRTSKRTVAQMRYPRLVEGQPHGARQSLASALSAIAVAATSYYHPGRHANAVTP